jgi:hypothetical protein
MPWRWGGPHESQSPNSAPSHPKSAPGNSNRGGPELYPLNDTRFGIVNTMHIAQRFEQLLDGYRQPDGSQWTGQQIDEATDGLGPRS